MSSVVSSSQFGTYTSSRDGSSISGSTDREHFSPTPENLERLVGLIDKLRRENELLLEYARQNNQDLFPQGITPEMHTRGRHRMRKRGKNPQLPTNRKLEIATQVIDRIEGDIKTEENRSSNQIAAIRARLIQISIREKELEKEQLSFQRDVLEGAKDERSDKIIGEKLLKWIDDLIKSKETKIGKLRLKRDSMRAQIARTKARLQQKLELGEKLQQVDYDQLQIDNDKFQDMLGQLSKELARLQNTSSNVVSKLQTARSMLSDEEKQCATIRQSIEQKKRAVQKYSEEAVNVEEDRIRLRSNNEDLATKQSEYRVPEVSDYIEKKAQIYELSKVIKNWERKVQLAEMNVRRLRKELRDVSTPR